MKKQSQYGKIIGLVAFISLAVWAYTTYNLGEVLTLENLKENQDMLIEMRDDNYALFAIAYVVIYIIVVAFSLPGATIMTLAGGFLFGLVGTLLVIFGASIGAVLASLVTRFFLRDALEAKFSKQLETFNKQLEEGKVGYMFSLRLLPIFPFFLINNLAGLSRLDMWTFFWTTAIGIIPGTFAYVNAGTQLSTIESLGDILSPGLIGAFVLLGLVSLVPNLIKKKLKK